MSIRTRALGALLTVTALAVAGVVSAEPVTRAQPSVVAAVTPAYAVQLNALHAYAPRSKGSDAISIAYSVAVNGNEYPVETVTLRDPVKADADVVIPPSAPSGLPTVRFDAARTDNVIVRYAVVNAKAGGSALAQGLLAQFARGGGRAAEDYSDTLWPSALQPLTPALLFSANCDGAVAVDAYTLSGGQIARSIAEDKGSFLVSKNYQGGDTSSGCGTQSNYDVSVRFSAATT